MNTRGGGTQNKIKELAENMDMGKCVKNRGRVAAGLSNHGDISAQIGE